MVGFRLQVPPVGPVSRRAGAPPAMDWKVLMGFRPKSVVGYQAGSLRAILPGPSQLTRRHCLACLWVDWSS